MFVVTICFPATKTMAAFCVPLSAVRHQWFPRMRKHSHVKKRMFSKNMNEQPHSLRRVLSTSACCAQHRHYEFMACRRFGSSHTFHATASILLKHYFLVDPITRNKRITTTQRNTKQQILITQHHYVPIWIKTLHAFIGSQFHVIVRC